MAVYLALAVRFCGMTPACSSDMWFPYTDIRGMINAPQVLRDQRAMSDALQQRQLGHPLGQTLLGKTAVLVGFGNIAVELVPRCVRVRQNMSTAVSPASLRT